MRLVKMEVKKSGRISIKYATKTNEDGESYFVEFSSPDKPPAELQSLFQSLKVYAGEILEFPESQYEQIEMRKIHFKVHEKTDSRAFIFTVLKHLTKTAQPVTINTPLKFDESEDESKLLPDGCLDALDRLKIEVERYLNSQKEQMELFKTAA